MSSGLSLRVALAIFGVVTTGEIHAVGSADVDSIFGRGLIQRGPVARRIEFPDQVVVNSSPPLTVVVGEELVFDYTVRISSRDITDDTEATLSLRPHESGPHWGMMDQRYPVIREVAVNGHALPVANPAAWWSGTLKRGDSIRLRLTFHTRIPGPLRMRIAYSAFGPSGLVIAVRDTFDGLVVGHPGNGVSEVPTR